MAVEDGRVSRVRVRGRGSTLNSELYVGASVTGTLHSLCRSDVATDARRSDIAASTNLPRQTPLTTMGVRRRRSWTLLYGREARCGTQD